MINRKKLIEYYSRDEIQQKILEFCEDRECVPKYNETYGKRPFTIFYKKDISSLAKKGMTSLHCSIELWKDVFLLGSKKVDINDLRKGWDFVIDIDFNYLPYSLIAAQVIVNFLRKKYNIKKINIKYSGNLGFHILITNNSFPSSFKGKELSKLYPQLPKLLAQYIFENTKQEIAKEILLKEEVIYRPPSFIKKILIKAGITDFEKIINEKLKNKNINFDKFLDLLFKKYDGEDLLNKLSKFLSLDLLVPKIDYMAYSPRHLIRCVYSLNEKSNLVSIPLDLEEFFELNIDNVNDFFRKRAHIDNVKTNISFNKSEKNSIKLLLLLEDALEFQERREKEELKKIRKYLSKEKLKDFDKIKGKISFSDFPPCIKNILNGLEDGKKRALFILTNFLYQVGYSFEEIQNIINEWNQKNKEPLKESYIKAQLKWFKKIFSKNKVYVLPNCDNEVYYCDINICQKDEICKRIKNPLTYIQIKNKKNKEK